MTDKNGPSRRDALKKIGATVGATLVAPSLWIKRSAASPAQSVVASTAADEQGTHPSRPNIVFITTDQQFSDAMSFRMGKRWINTPNLDALAAKGVFFTRAYAANPLCAPSRNSMDTGLYPHVTGIEKNSDLAIWNHWGDKKPIEGYWSGKNFESMGSYFKRAGYETAYFGKWHLNYNPQVKGAAGYESIDHFDKPINDESIPDRVQRFLRVSHNKPFMLWASFINPHDICQWSRFQKLPEGPIAKLPPVDEWPPLPPNLLPPKHETDAMTLIRESYHNNKKLFPVGDYSHFDWRRLRWGYYRLIEKVDAQIGQLLSHLKRLGYDNNTLILFTSDHGSCVGAHEFVQKTVFYEESERVPFILKYSGKISPSLNKTLVNTGIDILPTLMDFAGIQKPDSLPGISLKEAAAKNTTLKARRFIVCENKMAQGKPVAGKNDGKKPLVNGRMVRGERYKYCLYDYGKHREALFDLKDDPGETVNLAEKKSSESIIKRFRKDLEQWAYTYKDKKAISILKYVK